MSEQVRLKQFFGRSHRHAEGCVELTFDIPAEPVPLSSVEQELRRRIPGWREALPETLPAEEALALIARLFVARRIPAWTSCGREDSTAWVALGALSPRYASSILASLQHILLGSSLAQASAWKQFERIAKALQKERAINWNLMAEARCRQIECTWINPHLQIFQLGQASRGMHFCQLSNQRDSITGVMVENVKNITIEALHKLALPTTRNVIVNNAEGAIKAIGTVGFPCVVKPLSLSKGQGVTTGITNSEELAQAVDLAIRESAPPVLLENHVEGVDHRLTVVNDKVLWAYSKVPSAISGDGHSSVRMLIERENAFRNATKDTGLTILEPIPVDARLGSFLARRHGVGLDTILADGRRIELASEANISRGGVLQDVTARLHPDNRALALRVARYLRMNALGIDFVTPDISRSWKDVPCAIIEVNRTPGLSGVADAALAIRTLFPRKRSGQIPVFVAIGDAAFRDRASARLASAVRAVCARVETIEYLSREAFPPVIGGERPRPVQMSVLDPEIDALVLACDPEWIAERGFPLARADLALTEDPAAAAFLGDIIDEISPLPPEEDTVKRKVAAILADHADDGEPIPVVTFAAFENGFRIRCKRFATFPREQFCSELGLANDGTNHMVNFDDVFSAIWHLANAALEKAGAPRLGEMIDYSPPASAWTIRSVEGTISAREDTAEQTAQAVSVAIDAVNALFASGPD